MPLPRNIGRRLTLRRLDREVVETARLLHRRGLVAGTAGNVSVRVDRAIRITPTRARYESMAPRQIVAVDLDAGSASPSDASRELPLHLAIYRERDDVAAVIHTHSPYATAFSFTSFPLEPQIEDISYLGIGEIRTAPDAAAGSEALGAAAVAALGASKAVLLANHGVVAVGGSLQEALSVAEAVEHQAIVAWLSSGLGRGERAHTGLSPAAFPAAKPRAERVRRTRR